MQKALTKCSPTFGGGRFIAISRGLSARHSWFEIVSNVMALAPNSSFAILMERQHAGFSHELDHSLFAIAQCNPAEPEALQ